MKRIVSLFVVCFMAAIFTQPAVAQDSMKFGYVDVQRVVFTSQTGKGAINKIKLFQETRQKDITTLENELNLLEKENFN